MGGAVANSKRVSGVVVFEAVAHAPAGFHHQSWSYSLLSRAQNLRLNEERTALNTVMTMYVLSEVGVLTAMYTIAYGHTVSVCKARDAR
jgi:hypothetical protein